MNNYYYICGADNVLSTTNTDLGGVPRYIHLWCMRCSAKQKGSIASLVCITD